MRISDWSSDVCSSDLLSVMKPPRSARNWLTAATMPTWSAQASVSTQDGTTGSVNAHLPRKIGNPLPQACAPNNPLSASFALHAGHGEDDSRMDGVEEIGRASWRGKGCQEGWRLGGGGCTK